MNNEETQTEEIVIVGSRYGELADVVNPLYEQGLPIEPEDIKEKLGGDEVVLMRIPNKHDAYAVGVFTLSEQRLGHVWMSQAPALCQWLEDNTRRYISARIRRINTRYGLMMAEVELKLTPCDRSTSGYDMEWAANLPEVLRSINEQSLALGLALLHDELTEAEAWNEKLQLRIDNLLRNLPVDLSAHYYRESIDLYKAMKRSPIAEVRVQSDLVLNAFVKRGSDNQMEWWVNRWLPDFFREAADGDLLGLFEAAHYTLERVEDLLQQAPENLYYLYKVNRERFAKHLYYSALPQNIYNRLLTLLAVREAMLKKLKGTGANLPEELATATAMSYWQRLKDENFIDEDCQLLPTITRKQAMYIADLFSEKLKLKTKWKPFQDLWAVKQLAQEKWDIQQTGVLPPRYKDIDRIFE
jgi:hypothetical protein